MPFPDRFDPVATEDLPHLCILSIPRDELDEVVNWAQKFAPAPLSPAIVWCLLSVGTRRWVCTEANVDAWIDFTDPDQRDTAVVALPHHVLDSALLAFPDHDIIVIEADLGNQSLVVRAPGFSFRYPMPPVPGRVPVLDFPVGASLRASGSLVESAAQLLRVPSGRFEGESDAPWPYVTLTARGNVIELARDWSEFDGGRVRAVIEAIGAANSWEGSVGFYSEVLLRELWVHVSSDVDVVRFCFFPECPDIMVVLWHDHGLRVSLGSELVLRHRHGIEGALEEAGFEVERDDRRDWNPLVKASMGGTPITVEMVRAERIAGSHARIVGVVAEGLTWSTALGAELNSWNDAWKTSKLLFRDGALLVVRDLSIGSIGDLPDAARDLVDKIAVVRDVVGPLM